MESSIHSVPISATQMSPKASPSPSHNTLSGIRAPLTVDESDLEYSVSSKSRRNSTTSSYYSGSELDSSEDFVSGEDEFVTASDRPYVTDPDEEIHQETNFLEKYEFSRPPLISPNGEIVQERSNSVEHGFIRPSARNPVSGNAVFRPLVRNLDEIVHKGNSNADDDSDEDIKIPVVQKLHIPIAQVSGEGDSDEDSHSNENLEDEGFTSIVRIPSVEVLHRINRALKIRMVESDEEDHNSDFGDENREEGNFVVDTKDEEGHIGTEDSVHRVVSADLIEDKDSNVDKEAITNDLVVNEAYNPISELGQNGDLVHLDKEIQENDKDGDGKSSDAGLEDNLVFNYGIESEKPEIGTEEGMIVESFSFADAQKLECVCQYVDIKEMLEAHSDSLEVDLSDNDDCEYVFKESDNVEESHREIEDSSCHTVTEAMVAEIEESLIDHTQHVDGQNVIKSDEEFDADSGIGDQRQITASEGKNPDLFVPPSTNDEVEKPLSEIEKKQQLEKIQHIRVKYLRLLHRLNRSPEDSIASKILHLLSTVEAKLSSQAFHLDSAIKTAIDLELQKDDLDFSLCILVIGKTGVGKSATINSLFGETKTVPNAFEPSTSCVKEIIGTINGVKVKVFDTPGFRTSQVEDQYINQRVLSSIKKIMKKTPPDVILYIDRLDTQTDDNLNDLHVLKSITSSLSSSMWRRSILVLTHGTSIPPDEVFVAQKLRVFRKLISRSSEEMMAMKMNRGPLIPVSVVENRSFAEKNGESWRLDVLLLCYSIKTLSETSSSITTSENHLDNRKVFGLQTALSYFLSFLLQPNVHSKKRCTHPSGDSFVSDLDLGFSALSGKEEEDMECNNNNNLPSLKPSKKSQIANLSMGQRRGYFEEYEYSRVLDEDKIDDATRLSPAITAQLNDDKQELDIQLHSPVPLGLSITRHRGNTYGCKLQSRFSVGGNTKVNVGVRLNDRFNGQISIKTRSSDQRQIGALAFVVIFRAVFERIFRRPIEDSST